MKKRDIKNNQKQHQRANKNKQSNNQQGLTKCQMFVNDLIQTDQGKKNAGMASD